MGDTSKLQVVDCPQCGESVYQSELDSHSGVCKACYDKQVAQLEEDEVEESEEDLEEVATE